MYFIEANGNRTEFHGGLRAIRRALSHLSKNEPFKICSVIEETVEYEQHHHQTTVSYSDNSKFLVSSYVDDNKLNMEYTIGEFLVKVSNCIRLKMPPTILHVCDDLKNEISIVIIEGSIYFI